MGTVVDPGRLAIPAASVTLVNVATGEKRQDGDQKNGAFFFGSLQPGEYNLGVEAGSFKRLEKRGLNLSAAETLAAGQIVLEVGAVAEIVKVTAEGAAVQTASAERAGIITGARWRTWPSAGATSPPCSQLLPGVVDLGEQDHLDNNWNIHVLGNRNNTNNMSLDGATINAIGNNNNSVVNVSMDAVAEVKVLLSNYQAEYGRLSGANVQMVANRAPANFTGWALTSSGTNSSTPRLLQQPSGRRQAPLPLQYLELQHRRAGVHPRQVQPGSRQAVLLLVAGVLALTTASLPRITMPTELERLGDFRAAWINNPMSSCATPTTASSRPGQPHSRQPHGPQRPGAAQVLPPAQLLRPRPLARPLQLPCQAETNGRCAPRP